MELLRKRIQKHLDKTGMNQTEFGSIIGVTGSAISKLLDQDGNYKLTLDMALKLSQGMNIDVISIIKLAYPNAPIGDTSISPDAEMIAREFDKLSPEVKNIILTIITDTK